MIKFIKSLFVKPKVEPYVKTVCKLPELELNLSDATKKRIKIYGTNLWVGDRHLRYDSPIWGITEADGKLYVVIDPDYMPEPNRNLFCLDSDGELLWQVNYSPLDRPGFYSVPSFEDGKIVSIIQSFTVYLDKDTGEVISAEFSK